MFYLNYIRNSDLKMNKIKQLNLKSVEDQRIVEIKSLSYLERLERLMILIEVSYTLRMLTEFHLNKNVS